MHNTSTEQGITYACSSRANDGFIDSSTFF